MSVADSPRELFHKHPWSIGGGGAAELKELLEREEPVLLGSEVDAIGRTTVVGEDDAWILDSAMGNRVGFRRYVIRFTFVGGLCPRLVDIGLTERCLYPYDAS